MWRICYYFPYFTCILFLCFRPFPVNIYRLEVLNKTPLPWHSLDKIFVIQMYPLLYHVFKLLFVFLPRLLELECTSSKASAHIDTPPPLTHTHTHTHNNARTNLMTMTMTMVGARMPTISRTLMILWMDKDVGRALLWRIIFLISHAFYFFVFAHFPSTFIDLKSWTKHRYHGTHLIKFSSFKCIHYITMYSNYCLYFFPVS